MSNKQKEWRTRARKRKAIVYAVREDRYYRLTEIWKDSYPDLPMSVEGLIIIARNIKTINDELSKFVPSAPEYKELKNKHEHYYLADQLLNAILKNRVCQIMNTSVNIETQLIEIY